MLLDRWIYRLSQSKVGWWYPQDWGKTIGARGEYSKYVRVSSLLFHYLNIPK